MKKLSLLTVLSVVACLLFLNTFILTPDVYANPDNITIIVNGEVMEFGTDANDPYPYIKEGRTLIPFRRIFEKLQMEVTWDNKTRTVHAKNDTTVMELTIGQKTAVVNGVEHTLDVAPEITDDRTFVPLRFVSESVGAEVDWDAATRTVTITYLVEDPPQEILGGSGGTTKTTYKLGEKASYKDIVFTVDSITKEEDGKVIVKGTTNLNLEGMRVEVYYNAYKSLISVPIYNKNSSDLYEYTASHYNFSNHKPKYIFVNFLQDDGTYKTVVKYEL